MNNHSIIEECPVTGHKERVRYFDLGNIPLVNNLSNTREEALNAERFPLNINYYPASGESSLDFAVDSELLFSHYLFKSEVNKPYYTHCQSMFQDIQKYVEIIDNTPIMDIGGNDGTLLEAFKSVSNKPLNVLNVDPSKNLTELSKAKGIPVINSFFTYNLASSIPHHFQVITSTNVFQHLKDINDFAKGVEAILHKEGVWVLEFPYWIHDMETNQFDQIYHEHMYYHSVTPMKMLMEKHGLKVLNITKQSIHGGTLRLIIAKQESKHIPDSTVQSYIESEKNYGLDYHVNWGREVHHHIKLSADKLCQLKEEGKSIYGFGAAAKGCIYLNAMGIDFNTIDCIIDDTDLKQSKFVPGTGIEIVSRDVLKQSQPDYILILAHNFADHIIASLQLEYSGKFLILIPSIKEL